MNRPTVITALALGLAFGTIRDASARPCTAAEMRNLREPVSESRKTAEIRCEAELRPDDVITKKVRFEGPESSGASLRCNGAELQGGLFDAGTRAVEIRSLRTGTSDATYRWARPENIRLTDCKIKGTIRISGMIDGGDTTHAVMPSRLPGHTERARANAPTNITLERLSIEALGLNTIYISAGVTNVQLLNSRIRGFINKNRVLIYLDAESANNMIKGNDIAVTSKGRELIAVDGSSHNKIINNRFSGLNHGGIYLYRNCGEDGMVRHNTPSHNHIINNIFYYNRYTGGNPAIYIGSRDGNKSYCSHDSGVPLGSSISDKDHAQYNVVMQNRIIKRSVSDMIKTRNPALNSPNWIAHNESVSSAASRRSGCFLPSSFKTDFLRDGQSIDAVVLRDGRPSCQTQRCSDGELIPTGVCGMRTVAIECSVEGDNNGCRAAAQCPGERDEIIGVTAACNLEYGRVSTATLSNVAPGRVFVDRPSDVVSQGLCQVGQTSARERYDIIRGGAGRRQTNASCREHDKNGGDCHVVGTVYCKGATSVQQPAVELPPSKTLLKPNKLPKIQPPVLR